jgi:acyl carrier protein
LHTIAEHEEFPNSVPIGRAISNSGAYAVDGQKRLIPAGVVGELVVTGDGLARGYMDTSLDIDSFFQLKLADGQEVRAYRTGDLVRMRPTDSHFDFLGRVDHQLKIRGHRVELGEIEHTIATQEGVQSTIVVILTGSIGVELELAGFITTGGQKEPEPAGRKQLVHMVHEKLRAQLPSYMVPSRIALIEHMPVNSNGKVDRQILTQQAKDVPRIKEATAPTYTPPSDEIEEKLSNLYASILQSKVAPAVGIHDDFFDLGGHSLLATSLIASIRREMNVNISVKDVFERPKVVDLACKIRESTPAPLSNCSPTVYTAFQSLDVGDTEHFVASQIMTQLECKRENVIDLYPLNQIQKNHVHNPRTGRPRAPVNIYWDLPTVTDVSRVADTCRALVHRFDIFRTTFLPVAGTFYQVVLDCAEIPVEVHDVDNLKDATASSCHDKYRTTSEVRRDVPFDQSETQQL